VLLCAPCHMLANALQHIGELQQALPQEMFTGSDESLRSNMLCLCTLSHALCRRLVTCVRLCPRRLMSCAASLVTSRQH
jgi:hypothetical protein